MYTLYLDTHNNKIVSVLFLNDEIIVKKELITNYDHSICTMPIIIDTIKEGNIEVNNLNEILVVNGPGSFTGIRIGVTIAKTLAYSLNIPIKVLSSLLIKAISVEHNKEITIVEKEKNGVFVGIFDKGNNLLGEYKYLSNQEYKELAKPENEIEDIKINYSKIIEYSKNIKAINPHSVNPLYVKKIEVQK